MSLGWMWDRVTIQNNIIQCQDVLTDDDKFDA